MRDLEKACKKYYSKGFESFVYTSPVSGVVTVKSDNKRYTQIVYVDNGKLCFGDIEDLGLIGRPKIVDVEGIKLMKRNGYTQQAIAEEFKISLSTVRRHWKE